MKNKTEGYWLQTSERKISQEKEPKPHTHSRHNGEAKRHRANTQPPSLLLRDSEQ